MALATVSFKSFLSIGPFSFSLLLVGALSSFFINAFVACCSTNFLAKFFFGSGFLKVEGCLLELLESLKLLKGFFFSTENDFFPVLFKEDMSIFLVKVVDIVNVFFFSLLSFIII